MKGSVCYSEMRKLSILAQLCLSRAMLFSQGPESHGGMGSGQGRGVGEMGIGRRRSQEHRFQNQAGMGLSSPTRELWVLE